MDQLVSDLGQIVGPSDVLTGTDMARYSSDWLHQYKWQPRAIIRPATVEQVSEVVKLANRLKIPLVPMGGNTGLAGGTCGEASLVLSLERMAAIREIRPKSKVAIVEAGVILSNLHAAADAADLLFPLTFGARGSATLGGVLSTNAGGSNVLRYGNTRDLCLGLEVVLPNGEIMNLMSELHKDNSGYNLKHLMIGAEGTLGIITAAVMKLQAKPKVYATAMIATTSLASALTLLNDQAYVEMALAFAGRILNEPGLATDEQRIRFSIRVALSREAKPVEVRYLNMLLAKREAELTKEPKAADALLSEAKGVSITEGQSSRLAKWFTVANILLNLDEAITKG